MLNPEEIENIVFPYTSHLKNVVGCSTPYLREENGRVVYKSPLLVKTDDRTIDMVGIVEITLDPYSGKILKTYSEEEIKNKVNDLLSRNADG